MNRYSKKGKIIIKDINFDIQKKIMSFTVPMLINKNDGYQISLIERASKTEWVVEMDQENGFKDGFIQIDLNSFIKTYYSQNSRWDFYLIARNSLGNLEKSRLGVFDQEVGPKYGRYLNSTTTEGVTVATPYLTDFNGLSLVISESLNLISEKLDSSIKIVKFQMKGNMIHGKLHVQLPEVDFYRVKAMVLKYRSKVEDIEYEFPVLEKKRTRKFSIVNFTIDVSQLKLENYYWDFYLVAEMGDQPCLIKLKNPTNKVKRIVSKKTMKQSYIYENGFFVQPYITGGNTVALLYKEKETYESSMYYFKEKIAYFIYILFKWYFDRKNIWLAYEKFTDTAQDNGFYFFQYCYNNGHHKNFYYVIKNNSPDYHNVKPMEEKVIHFMSFKYMIMLFAAKLLISSESKGHVYDIRIQKGLLRKSITSKRQVFLQHGVLSLKRIDQVFNKKSKNAVDLFVVSSEYEKEIVKNNFGYKDEEIIITGLSRWDSITDQSKGKSSILLMPTWRSWMDDLPAEKFIQTDYYIHYVSLLNSRTLESLLEQHNIQLDFFIHPKFKAYIDQFSSNNKRIKIYQSGEEKVNKLLMQSSMLITDYSSVSWDMYYQKKPIVFYQFDITDYNKYQGSYIDMETELFGDRAFTVKDLIELINKYAERNFEEEKKYGLMRERYLQSTDQNHSSRIYKEIENNAKWLNKRKKSFIFKNSSLLRNLWKIAKRNETSFKAANRIRKIIDKSYQY